ncbi:MAG: FHA domain-containing protein [Candidatus Limnocylindrales bacterium]
MYRVTIRPAHGEAPASVLVEVVPFVIGRLPDADLQLDDEAASGRHAQLEVQPDGRVVLRDLGSTNGTWVDRTRITGGTWLALPGSFRVGSTTLLIERVADEVPPNRTVLLEPLTAVAAPAVGAPLVDEVEGPAAPAAASSVPAPMEGSEPAEPMAEPVVVASQPASAPPAWPSTPVPASPPAGPSGPPPAPAAPTTVRATAHVAPAVVPPAPSTETRAVAARPTPAATPARGWAPAAPAAAPSPGGPAPATHPAPAMPQLLSRGLIELAIVAVIQALGGLLVIVLSQSDRVTPEDAGTLLLLGAISLVAGALQLALVLFTRRRIWLAAFFLVCLSIGLAVLAAWDCWTVINNDGNIALPALRLGLNAAGAFTIVKGRAWFDAARPARA